MTVLLSMTSAEVQVSPGGEAVCSVEIRNVGFVVDHFSIELIGDFADWADIEPKVVNLLPDSEVTAQITFKPPETSAVLAGEKPFAVRVTSREDPESSVVEEGTVTVDSFTKISAEFTPKGSRGSRKGRHRLAIDNEGNIPTRVDITLLDPEQQLDFSIKQRWVVTEPGTATLIPVKAIPKKRFLKGPPKTHPFQASVTGKGFDTVTADAVMVQEQIFPKWLPTALVALVALAILFAVLWLTVLHPVLKSEARQAAAAQASELSQGVAQASQQAANASQNAQAALNATGATPVPSSPAAPSSGSSGAPNGQQQGGGTTGGDGASTGGGAGSGSTPGGGGSGGDGGSSGQPTPAAPSPVDFTLRTFVPAGNGGTFKTFSYTAPKGKTLLIYDFVLSNPNGDTGNLEVRRGNVMLMPFGLENFRTQDQNFTQPIKIPAGQPVVLAVDCHNESRACTPAAYFSGQLQ
uniref:Hydrolytic protein n=1 Tax=Streptomyces sp. NBC_00180 TaxID=2903632 RepID=A0AAU1ICK6_9ACTN